MWAVGHLALGYFAGKGVSKALNERLNIPLLFFSSLAPDFDIIIPSLAHRGPTHSLIVYALALIPFYLVFGRKTLIYFASISSHALVGDLLFTGGNLGVQILWPLNSTWFLGPNLPAFTDVILEGIFFSLFLIMAIKVRDLQKLFEPNPQNLVLTMPIFAIFMPVFLGFPVGTPFGLLIPHLVCLAILTYSIFLDLKSILINKKS
ncbi:MAG: metal-dependent hydrolase [Candidatus Bathyarchaeota archaeon]